MALDDSNSIPMQQRLRKAHELLSAQLEGDIEPFDVWQRVEEHRSYWRPERVKLILLAESHVRTSQRELEHRLSVQPGMPADLPTGFVRLVYSLGYGEDDALDRPIGRPRNDGTWQFWKIFYSCVNSVRTNADFAPILKGGTRTLDTRMANKIAVLTELKARGIWLLDASVAGLYSPKGVNASKPGPTLRKRVLETSWDGVISAAIQEANAEAILCIGIEVASVLETRLNKLRVPWGRLHQPQSHLTSQAHMSNWTCYYQVSSRPSAVRHLPSVV